MKCTQCNGDGYYIVKRIEPNGKANREKHKCKVCGGTGELDLQV